MTNPSANESMTGRTDVDLIDLWLVVWRRKWLILGVMVLVVGVTFGVTIQMPRIYEATTTLLAPKEGTAGGFLSTLAATGLAQQMPLASLNVPSLTPNRDVLVSILKSRTVATAVVEKHRLQERYRAQFQEDAVKGLLARTGVSVSREGVVAVKVEETHPALAAEIANSYIEQLDRLVGQFGSGETSRQKVFVGEQLVRSRRDLERAEEALRRFQERNRAIVLQEQTRGTIEAAGRLKGEIMATEVQLQVMRNFATESNPEVVTVRRRIEEMKRQLAQVQYGEDLTRDGRGSVPGARPEIHIPFSKVPELSLELARQTRDLKVQETLVTLLAQQLEQARIAEARDLPAVQVLDRAVPPARPSKPSLRLNLLVMSAVSLFGGMFFAFLLEYVQRSRVRTRLD